MIKVLHIVGTMNMGGQETFIMNVFRCIDKSKFSFDFLCLGAGEYHYSTEIKELGGKLFNLEENASKYTAIRLLTRRKKVRKFLSEHKYDVVHIHTAHSISYLIAKAVIDAGIKTIIVHSHSSCIEEGILTHRLLKKKLSNLNIIKLACSDEAAQWLYSGDLSNVKIIYNGVDIEKFKFNATQRIKIRQELNIGDKFVIGYVARFVEQKNHKFLINLFSKYHEKYKDSVLCMVGDGELRKECEALVESLGIKNEVIFLGTRPDVNDILNAYDLFLFPSLFEGLPFTGVEAQVNALPVIASDVISKQMVISRRVKLLSLDAPMDDWIEAIREARQLDRAEFEKTENYDNFDIKVTQRTLMDIYCQNSNSNTNI